MLVVLALCSCGITTTVASASFGKPFQSETEEIEESVLVSSQPRRESALLRENVANLMAILQPCAFARRVKAQRAIVGHRHANGLLAPIRC